MAFRVSKATSFINVETNQTNIEVIYYKPNIDVPFVDCFATKGKGNWNCISFNPGEMSYEIFVSSMIHPNLETIKSVCSALLETILNDINKPNTYLRIINAIFYLDYHFKAPRVNMDIEWHRDFITDFCNNTIPHIIDSCNDFDGLNKFFNILKLIHQKNY
jgi:hypothetical protein